MPYPCISESWQRAEREEGVPWGPRKLRSQKQRNREPKRKIITKILRQQEKYRLQRDRVYEHALDQRGNLYAQGHTTDVDRVGLVFRPPNSNSWVLSPHQQPGTFRKLP